MDPILPEGFRVLSSIAQSPDAQDVKWGLPVMVSNTQTGGKLYWQIGFDGEAAKLVIATAHHPVEHITYRMTEVRTNTSGRDLQQQALLEARNRYKQKYCNDGYRPIGDPLPEVPEPALCHKWVPDGAKKDASQRYVRKWPVLVQPKLDGIRNLARMIGQSVMFRTRINRERKHFDDIRELVKVLFTYLPAGSELDGEFYTSRLSFTQLTSAVKTEKTISPLAKYVQYYVFDIRTPEPMSYSERAILLSRAFAQMYQDVPSTADDESKLQIVVSEVAHTSGEVQAHHDRYVMQGYEGIIIRDPEEPYRPGRTAAVLKYKEFEDMEGTVVGVEEASGTEVGAAILLLRYNKEKDPIPVRMRGPLERRRAWLQNPSTIIGKEITFRFQGLSEYGVPRFPVGISVRDYE